MADNPRTAVVLFNLGGPDSLDAVRPFLFNLFNDPAIIPAPTPIRWGLAQWISRRRAPVAREIYEHMGGRSPLVPETEAQAVALSAQLALGGETRVFIAMRYWHPFAEAAAAEVAAFAPDRVVLLPLYPQFSTTTTASSVAEWRKVAAAAGIDAPTHTVCCYPDASGLIAAHADGIRAALAETPGPVRVLFSAHGLPQRVIDAGDPYQWQVERMAAAIAEAVAVDGLDWRVCYQSRVGRLVWIGPSTDDEIRAAGADGVNLVVVPIAFVSEHSETLVELDIEYRDLAAESGVAHYTRVPALGTAAPFINELADLVKNAVTRPGCQSGGGGRLCPDRWSGCPAVADV